MPGYSALVHVSQAEIQRLAERIVDALLKQGNVKPKADRQALVQRIFALIQKNMEEDAALEEEAERMAEAHSRKMAGADVDQRRVVQMIKRKLAEERGFPL